MESRLTLALEVGEAVIKATEIAKRDKKTRLAILGRSREVRMLKSQQ